MVDRGMRTRAVVVVSGLVQGVSFRWYTAEHARRHDVCGWVRNLPDGRLEAVFEGPKADVEAMVDWCRTGPRYARVEAVEVAWSQAEGLTRFDIVG